MQNNTKKITTLQNAEEGTSMQNQLETSMENPTILYSSCDTLPIKLFYQLLNDPKKLELLGKGNLNQLSNVWSDILDEYWNLSDPVKYSINLRKSIGLITKRNKYTTVLAGLMLSELGQKSGIDTINHFGYKNVDDAKHGLRILKTKISLALAKNTKKETKIDYNIYKDTVILEQILGRAIDLDKTVVSYWVELNKLAKELNKPKGKNRSK